MPSDSSARTMLKLTKGSFSLQDLSLGFNRSKGLGFLNYVLFLVIFGLIGCNANSEKIEFPQVPPKPLVSVVELEFVNSTNEEHRFFGMLVPRRQRTVGFGKAGAIRSLQPDGARVPEGTLLCDLNQAQLETRKSDVERLLTSVQNEPSSAANQQQMAELEFELQNINSQLAPGIVYAPYDCVVVETFVEIGGLAQPQSPIMRIMDVSFPNIQVNLPRRIADQLSQGDSITAKLGDATLESQVIRIAIEEKPVGNKTIWLAVHSGLEQVTWDFRQPVSVDFTIDTEHSGFWIPRKALVREADGIWSVFATTPIKETTDGVSDHQVSKKIVSIIQVKDDSVLIDGDLTDGDLIITTGLHRVVSGQAVRVSYNEDQVRDDDASEEFPESIE